VIPWSHLRAIRGNPETIRCTKTAPRKIAPAVGAACRAGDVLADFELCIQSLAGESLGLDRTEAQLSAGELNFL
jgi:hypothetical protein